MDFLDAGSQSRKCNDHANLRFFLPGFVDISYSSVDQSNMQLSKVGSNDSQSNGQPSLYFLPIVH
jgi:hypothetical protein